MNGKICTVPNDNGNILLRISILELETRNTPAYGCPSTNSYRLGFWVLVSRKQPPTEGYNIYIIYKNIFWIYITYIKIYFWYIYKYIFILLQEYIHLQEYMPTRMSIHKLLKHACQSKNSSNTHVNPQTPQTRMSIHKYLKHARQSTNSSNTHAHTHVSPQPPSVSLICPSVSLNYP